MTLISAMMTSPQLVEGKMKTVLVQQKKNKKSEREGSNRMDKFRIWSVRLATGEVLPSVHL